MNLMKRNRRLTDRILSLLLAIIVASATMTMVAPMTGCTTQQAQTVVTDIQKFMPAVTNIAAAVCGVIVNPLCGTIDKIFVADATTALQIANDYLTAVAKGTNTASAWQLMDAALQTMYTDADKIFAMITVVPQTMASSIQALIGSAQVLLAVIETVIPGNPSAPKAMSAHYAAHLPAGRFDLSKWTAEYNANVKEAQKVLPRNVSLKTVHVHSTALRVVTLGVKK